jgi:hypothetical protein
MKMVREVHFINFGRHRDLVQPVVQGAYRADYPVRAVRIRQTLRRANSQEGYFVAARSRLPTLLWEFAEAGLPWSA